MSRTSNTIGESTSILVGGASNIRMAPRKKEVERKNAGKNDRIVIAFMGVTGSGKSSFIRAMTGREDIAVGNGLEATTQTIATYETEIDSIKFALIDTPGFNDTYRSENEILVELATWLSSTYSEGLKLTGIVYLQPIHETRMEGSACLNLYAFRKLCGLHAFEHVVLCSTFWDLVDEAVGEKRENELCNTEEFWGGMRELGSKVCRIKDYAKSKDILLRMAKKRPVALQIQQELVDEDRQLEETEASKVINAELLKLKAQQEVNLAKAKKAAAAALARKEAETRRRLAEQEAADEALRASQRAIADAQRAEAERLNRQRLRDAERKLQHEQELKNRQQKKEAEARKNRELEEKRLREERAQKEAKAAEEKKKQEELARKRMCTTVRDMFAKQANALEEAQRIGTVKAAFYGNTEQSPSFLRWCDCCFQMIGFEVHYHCLICQFDVCSACKQMGRGCNSYIQHTLRVQIPEKPPASAACCQRLTNSFEGIKCDRCSKSCYGLYFRT